MINLPSEVISPSENPNENFPILVALQRIKSMLPTGAGAMNSVWKLTVVTDYFCLSSLTKSNKNQPEP